MNKQQSKVVKIQMMVLVFSPMSEYFSKFISMFYQMTIKIFF